MTGPQGAPGESAYQIYKRLKGGDEPLTESAWIASLKGEKGDRGETGTAGLDGQSDIITTQPCATSPAITIGAGTKAIKFINEIPTSYDAGLRLRITGNNGYIEGRINSLSPPNDITILSDDFTGTLGATLNTSACRVQSISPAVRAGFLFGAGKGIQKNSVNYFGPGMTWDGIGQASADIVAIPSPSGGILSNLRVNLAGPTTGGTRYIITVIKSSDGVNWASPESNLFCEIVLSSSVRKCEQLDVSKTLTISPGDLLAVRVEGVGGTSSNQTLQWSVTLAPNG
jgi:hypothetical protein